MSMPGHDSPPVNDVPTTKGGITPIYEDVSCSISRLPPEVLAEVFRWCIIHVQATFVEEVWWSVHLTPYSWLSFRAVCRHWRAVCLSYPTLSSHIWLTRSSCVNNMLSLSGDVPLYVYAIERAFANPEEVDILGSVLRASQRIAHATFVLSKDTIDLLFSLGKDAFPRLSSLSLYSARFWAPPELLFPNIDFPALRELECHNLFRVSSLSTITSTLLRSLHLTECGTTLREQMLPLLRQLPGLEELVLERALENWILEPHMVEILTSPPDPLLVAALPHLKLLRIDEDWGDLVVMFLKYLSFPRSTSMTLKVHRFSHLDLLSATYLSVILLGLKEAAPQTLLVSCETGRLTISLWDTRLPASSVLKPRVTPPRFSCTLNFPSSQFIADMIVSLPLSRISSACLVEQFVGLWYVPHWASLLARTPAVQELSLRYEAFDSVLPGGPRYRTPSMELLGLPGLQSVEICEMHHPSAAIPDFDAKIAHLGVVAEALQSHVGIDVKKGKEDLHEGRGCQCGGQSELSTGADAAGIAT